MGGGGGTRERDADGEEEEKAVDKGWIGNEREIGWGV